MLLLSEQETFGEESAKLSHAVTFSLFCPKAPFHGGLCAMMQKTGRRRLSMGRQTEREFGQILRASRLATAPH